jgi:hypothetical protein
VLFRSLTAISKNGDTYYNETTGRIYQFWAGVGWKDLTT